MATYRPNKAALLKVLTSALANKAAAEELASIINGIQQDIFDLTAKLDSDIGVADEDYEDLAVDNATVE